jgi:hypothetical protein
VLFLLKKKKTMVKRIIHFVGIFLVVTHLTGCSKNEQLVMPPPLLKDNSALGIENKIPSSLDAIYVSNFNRYTKVVAPNGKSIHIVAQNKLTTEQIIRCRSILEHYLQNLPNSQYGDDKSAVANKMADNKAVLCLLNGSDNGKNPIGNKIQGQPLYENEIQVEGHPWYMQQDYENHRDAAFEEILHLVHDYGIGVDGESGFPGALPGYQGEIRNAQINALNQKLWGIGANDIIQELKQENSLTQEYLASIIDSYYGLWGAWGGSETKGMWGLYIAKTRAEIATEDTKGSELMKHKFFAPYLTYNARIDASLNGNFSLKRDASKPYTHCSQYLKDITLLGSNDNSVTVNGLNNDITGNKGMNKVIFSGKHSEYTIITTKGVTIVIDNVAQRDGKNTLRKVEKLEFSDQIISL